MCSVKNVLSSVESGISEKMYVYHVAVSVARLKVHARTGKMTKKGLTDIELYHGIEYSNLQLSPIYAKTIFLQI